MQYCNVFSTVHPSAGRDRPIQLGGGRWLRDTKDIERCSVTYMGPGHKKDTPKRSRSEGPGVPESSCLIVHKSNWEVSLYKVPNTYSHAWDARPPRIFFASSPLNVKRCQEYFAVYSAENQHGP